MSTKIIHYSSLVYFPLTYLAALSIFKIFTGECTFGKLHKAILIIAARPIFIAPIVLTYAGFHPEFVQSLLSQDPFAKANLEAEIHWTGLEVIPSLVLLTILIIGIVLINRKRVLKGATFLFGGTAIWVFLTLIFFIKRVEGISQRANIEFWESKIRRIM